MGLIEIQKKLNSVSCPMCNHPTLDVTLRCYTGYEECLPTARCLTCGTPYTISNERSMLKEWKEADSNDTELRFCCELPSRKCFLCGQLQEMQ
mgnify:FL=1